MFVCICFSRKQTHTEKASAEQRHRQKGGIRKTKFLINRRMCGRGGPRGGRVGKKTNKVERAKQGRNVNKNRIGGEAAPRERERERERERDINKHIVINIGVFVFV